MQECAHGNESIGSEWVEAKIFSKHSTLSEVIKWQASMSRRTSSLGKLYITIAHEDENEN